MSTTTEKDPRIVADEYSLAVAAIEPDPDQPRLEVDDELADSIKSQGVLQAITVRPHPEHPDRYMIVDGERRWRGAKKAGLREIPATLKLDVEGVNVAERLIRQIVHNSGKPLTPVEEALAFKKIIEARRLGTPEEITVAEATKRKLLPKADRAEAAESQLAENDLVTVPGNDADPKYGPTQLARDLGLPKSTVTDRLAMTEIASFWFRFIARGPLQASHVPLLHKIRNMPEKYQLRVLSRLQEHHEWPTPDGKPVPGSGQPSYRRHAKHDERIRIDDFEDMMEDALQPFIRPLGDVGKQYKGPTAKLKDARGWPRTEKVMAIDPTQWEPILRKRRADKAKKTRAAGGAQEKETSWQKENRLRNERWERERVAKERAEKRLRRALPAITEALREKAGKLTFAQRRTAIVHRIRGVTRGGSKAAWKAAEKAATPEKFLEALLWVLIEGGLAQDWGFTERVPKLGREFGVDVAKLAKAGDDEETKAATPATAAAESGGDQGDQGDEGEDDEE